jgi:hypothetical protein
MRPIHAGCARHIRESDANVARTCRARSAQQRILFLDPSVSDINIEMVLRTSTQILLIVTEIDDNLLFLTGII